MESKNEEFNRKLNDIKWSVSDYLFISIWPQTKWTVINYKGRMYSEVMRRLVLGTEKRLMTLLLAIIDPCENFTVVQESF